MTVRSRLAPTPSGFLHYGNLFNFVLTWKLVRQSGGVLKLRIDDLDLGRVREDYVEDIFSTLNWLGFDWDEGPKDSDEFRTKFSQTLRTEEYREFLKKFPGYACECSRQQVRARTEKFYDGKCRTKKLPLIKDHTQWRHLSDIPEHDVVLWQKTDLPAYHLVSLYEDLADGISHIVRGDDLRESTAAQLRLAKNLGQQGEAFININFIHHPLLLSEGEKLSKSAGAYALSNERRMGKSASEVYEKLSRFFHKPLITSLAESLKKW
jgi:glutamyl/glutaminyl-tRNA synthetase